MHIGIGIGSAEVRVIAVEDDRIVLAAAESYVAGEAGPSIEHLLRRLPRSRFRQLAAMAAIGPAQAQLRRLTGLPANASSEMLASIVRENAGRFFLRNGTPILTTTTVEAVEGGHWAAALDAPAVIAAELACLNAGVRLEAVVASAQVLSYALVGKSFQWSDGDAAIECRLEEGQLLSTRRLNNSYSADEPVVMQTLNALGEGAARFADAYGAAVAPIAATSRWIRHRTYLDRPLSRIRLVAATAVASAGVVLALVAPLVGAARAERRAAHELHVAAPAARAAAMVQQQGNQFRRALNEVERFRDRSFGTSRLLTDLARSLPDSSAIVALRADSDAASIVVVGPRAQRALAALEGMRSIASPQISGPVTRELVGGIEMERLTLTFRTRRRP